MRTVVDLLTRVRGYIHTTYIYYTHIHACMALKSMDLMYQINIVYKTIGTRLASSFILVLPVVLVSPAVSGSPCTCVYVNRRTRRLK